MPEGQKVYSQGHKPLDKKISTRNNPKGVEEEEFSFRLFRANHFIIHLLLGTAIDLDRLQSVHWSSNVSGL